MKNKILTLVICLSVIVAVLCFVACSSNALETYDTTFAHKYNTDVDNSAYTADLTGKTLTVGAVMVGDESEGYTKAHMDGINAAKAFLEGKGATVNIIWKKSIGEDATCATACTETISAGATLVITNSYGHQFAIGDTVAANPSVTFVSMTGDLAAGSGNANWKNAFTDIYQSRYVSGVAAGLKLKQLVEDGKLSASNYKGEDIKIGYVGAYPYAEVVSGYTAFYLGIKSVVSNVVMSVKYTNSWFDFNKENETAKALIADGCVIIGQHADSEGAPTACETAFDEGTLVYSVGYNVGMLQAAPRASLTSSTNNWSVYYTNLFYNKLTDAAIETDWHAGYEAGAVGITELNGKAFKTDISEEIAAKVAAIKAGTLHVFDCASFTVNGAHLTTYTSAYGMGGAECIKKVGDVYYFDESVLRSAPYFDIRIDGITESGAAAA